MLQPAAEYEDADEVAEDAEAGHQRGNQTQDPVSRQHRARNQDFRPGVLS